MPAGKTTQQRFFRREQTLARQNQTGGKRPWPGPDQSTKWGPASVALSSPVPPATTKQIRQGRRNAQQKSRSRPASRNEKLLPLQGLLKVTQPGSVQEECHLIIKV